MKGSERRSPCDLSAIAFSAQARAPGGTKPKARHCRSLILATILLGSSSGAAFAAGPFGIDHPVAYDDSGVWKRQYQIDLAVGTAAVVAGGALWEGGDTPLGATLWRSVDSMALTAATTQVMKLAFSRERPSQSSDPDRFFTGHGNQSFPSGEVAEIAAAVTPIMMAYVDEYPALYALALLPAYDAVARVKVHGHWQSDVLAGAAVGTAIGYYAGRREQPFVLGVLPQGFYFGLKTTF